MFVAQFVKEDPNRQKAFTKEMEEAAILCLTEAKRKKQSLLRGSAEETECISKLCYPLWAVPWNGRCVVVDGLGLTSTTTAHSQIPAVQEFTENLERSKTSFKLFAETLQKHERTFEKFLQAEKVGLDALVSDTQVLEALSLLINEHKILNGSPEANVVFVPQVFEKARSDDVAERLRREWLRAQTDVDALQYATKILREETRRHKEKASVELDQIWGSYEERISEVRKEVNKNVKSLEKNRIKEVARAEAVIKKDMEKLAIEERKLRKKNSELRHSLDLILAQKRTQQHSYPKRSTTRIDNRISLVKEKIEQSDSELRRMSNLQEETRANGRQQLGQIEAKFQSLLAKETEKLEALERSRNAEMLKKTDEQKKTQDLSQKIEAQINSLTAQKDKDAETLRNTTIPLKADEPSLVGIPFYVVQYRQQQKTRIDVYPPVMAASYKGIVRKIQKAVFSFSLESRIQLLLTPRSKDLDKAFFDNLERNLTKNIALKEQVAKAAQTANILLRPEFQSQIAMGLSELEAEGWLNQKEKESIQSVATTK